MVVVAEGVGFEPTVGVRPQRFSRPSDSAALASLQQPLCAASLGHPKRYPKLSLGAHNAGHVPRIRERAPGVYEITASTGRRDPATGKYGQVSRTVKDPVRRPGAKGFPKAVETEAAKLMAEVEGGRHQAGRHTFGVCSTSTSDTRRRGAGLRRRCWRPAAGRCGSSRFRSAPRTCGGLPAGTWTSSTPGWLRLADGRGRGCIRLPGITSTL